MQRALEHLPVEYQRQSPKLVWLLLIPGFNLVWNFFVFPKVAASYLAYFQAQEGSNLSDCGQDGALIICLLWIVSPFVPCLGFIGFIIIGVMFVLFNNRINELKKMMPANNGAASSVGGY